MVDKMENPEGEIKIALVGKYIEFDDAYKCIYESLYHSAASQNKKLTIIKVNSGNLNEIDSLLENVDGVLVPGGFGSRGVEGKIMAARYCRENEIPYFGICLGMQTLCISFAREILNLKDANSTEFDKDTKNPVVSMLSEQENVTDLGGTMRLGSFACNVKSNSKALKAYGQPVIKERHRHRFEFNNYYKQAFEKHGCKISGEHPVYGLVEIVEKENHPWMVGVQFHPEFISKPDKPHPLFNSFIEAAVKKSLSLAALV